MLKTNSRCSPENFYHCRLSMRVSAIIPCLFIFLCGCLSRDAAESAVAPPDADSKQAVKPIAQVLIASADTIIKDSAKTYTNLVFDKKETIVSAPGTKSVLFNTPGTRLYAMNLEGMSVYEFDQSSRKVLREFKFKPTKGT